MRVKKLALAAAAVLGVAGLTGAAAAATQNSHVLTVQLPGGGTAHILYFGDTPPQVRLEPVQALGPAAFFAPGFPADRAMAEMDRQADLMFAQAQALMSAGPGGEGLMRADLGRAPAGVTGYSYVSTVSSQGGCTRAVEFRSTGTGRPQVISRTSGHCGGGTAPSGATSGATSGGTSRATSGAPSVTTSAAASVDGQPPLRLERVAYSPAS